MPSLLQKREGILYELLFLDKLSEPIHKLFTFILYILFQYFDVNRYPLNKEEGIFFTCQAKIQALAS